LQKAIFFKSEHFYSFIFVSWNPELITDPIPNLQIISDPAGSGCTTLVGDDDFETDKKYIIIASRKNAEEGKENLLLVLDDNKRNPNNTNTQNGDNP
jgi:hypothetical protein